MPFPPSPKTWRTNTWFCGIILVAAVVQFGLPPLSRQLLNYDDGLYVAPLHHLSFNDYWTTWLPRKDHYAFPLRDLSYALDFALSDGCGLNTFWLTNFLFFALTLLVFRRVLRLVLPNQDRHQLFLLAAVALHPLQVEVVQWTFMRKYTLVALLIAHGTAVALQVGQTDPERVRSRSYVEVLVCYIGSLLCWPAGVLWIFWAAFEMRKALRAAPIKAAAFGAATMATLGAYLWFIVSRSSDYTLGATRVATPSAWGRALYFGWRGVGRLFYNFLIPIRLAVQYNERSPLNAIGLALLALCFLAFLVSFARDWRSRPSHAAAVLSLLALTASLLIPELFAIATHVNFVVADHYWHLPLPYLLMASALWLAPFLTSLAPSMLSVAGGAVLFAYSMLSLQGSRYWVDDYSLLTRCAETEGAAQCRALAIERAFDRGGCALAGDAIQLARDFRLREPPRYWSQLSIDLPLFESLCASNFQGTLDEKIRNLEEIKSMYAPAPALLYGEVSFYLDLGLVEKAYTVATRTYLNPEYALDGVSRELVNMLRRQTRKLCTKVSPELANPCRARAAVFERRLDAFPVEFGRGAWAN